MSHVSHEWYTAEEKNRIVQDYLASGLSLRKYSVVNDVKLPTLSAWIRKYNQENQISSNFQNVTPILKQDVSKTLEQTVSVLPMVKITIPNGISIECPIEAIRKQIGEMLAFILNEVIEEHVSNQKEELIKLVKNIISKIN